MSSNDTIIRDERKREAAGGDTSGLLAREPRLVATQTKRQIRVASVQMALAPSPTPDSFFGRVSEFVRVAGEYGADFICFPEHFTLQLLSTGGDMVAADATVTVLDGFTAILRSTLPDLAKRHGINIIGGSHACVLENGEMRNVTFIAHRTGMMDVQAKIHPTPDERDVWGLSGGSVMVPFDTDCGPIGVNICYDSEFPELARHLVDQAEIGLLFVPYCTDTRQGHLRVTYCCQARAIENQCFVVTSGLVGQLPGVANLEMAYAQSAVFTPSDHGFARDGIAARAEPQIEQMIFAHLDLGALDKARREGSVRNLADRRPEIYKTIWQNRP